MAKVHNFKECLKIEREGYDRQDKFYLQHFHCIPFNERIPYEENRNYQCSDRDLDFIYNGEVKSISEKNRTKDFPDTLFEIYSKYNFNKLGWGMESTATLLCYFLPSSVMVVNMQDAVGVLANNDIQKQVGWYEGYTMNDFTINGNKYKLPIIRAQNDGYSTISIALTDSQMRELGIRFKRF